MDKFVCFATLATGSKIKLTQEDYNKFLEVENDSFLAVAGRTFKKSAVMEIEDINNYVEEDYSYGQPYTALPPGIGFKGLIVREDRSKAIELMAKGLKKAKASFGGKPTPKIDSLLKIARERYVFLKQNKEPVNKFNV